MHRLSFHQGKQQDVPNTGIPVHEQDGVAAEFSALDDHLRLDNEFYYEH
jgi:hypothetical protein